MSKILITGATGHFGKETIKFLLKREVPANQIYALVRNENKASDLKEKGINLISGDYEDYNSLVAAFSGVDKLLFISGSDVVNRTGQHENVVKAAKEANVKHVIYTSSLSTVPVEESEIAFVAEAHVRTEEWLAESGLNYTLFRNNLYMDLVPQFIGEKVLETGVIYLPADNGKSGFVLRSEMAEAAAIVLTSGGHVGKIYNITNLETYSYQDVADSLSEITGKSINYVSPTADEFVEALKNMGVSQEMISGFTAFALAQAANEFNITGRDLAELLGRNPKTLVEYLTEIYGNN